MLKTIFLVSLAVWLYTTSGFAQVSDSLNIQIGTTGTVASKSFQPLWIAANRFGTIADIQTDASSHFKITNRRSFYRAIDYSDSVDIHNRIYVDLGLDVYNNNHFSRAFIQEGYVKVGYRNWQVRVGRFEEVSGDVDKDLSSGSWGISGNALPIPKVGIAISDYTIVPNTKGWLKFKGQVSHGWFGNNRFMKDAFLHEKMLYVQLGRKKLNLYGGVQHFAEWAGRRGDIKLEKSWKGFFDVLTVKRADDGSYGGPVQYANRPGDQRGLLEFGANWDVDKIALKVYNQTMFETGRDIDFRNIDRLLGASVAYHNKPIGLQKILAEFVHTKQALNFVEKDDRQSYYNNGYYRTGWEYENRIIGTPLFYNNIRAGKFLKEYGQINWNLADTLVPSNQNVISNRLIGFHLGALYNFTPVLAGKTLITFSRNFGTYAPSFFTPGKTQYHTLQEFSYGLADYGFVITAGLAFDFGQLYDNVGGLISVQWNFESMVKKFD